MTPLPLMTLSGTFDVNQRSDRMDWEFLDIGAVPGQPPQPGGEHWNSDVFFSAGQSFCIALTATDNQLTGFQSFQILDCHLITRPQILRCGKDELTLYAPPSPFVDAAGDTLNAVCPIAGTDFLPLSSTQPNGSTQQTMLWANSLTVGGINAHWEMSLYITVSIQRAWSEQQQLRVFYFDPESEVGNGTTPPDVVGKR
ncbi:hypothetical protein [Duganella sp. HH101]|uniref:hypothetical protein n=1 Tax=Duganella sp. HH101 TaxID=1781066 RepID=UPI000893F5D9|nr:hypothetical protein [Duganella sp. HH101]OFA02610.1 hypothetical protein DUGA2_34600 [Duganella sp. HH101]